MTDQGEDAVLASVGFKGIVTLLINACQNPKDFARQAHSAL